MLSPWRGAARLQVLGVKEDKSVERIIASMPVFGSLGEHHDAALHTAWPHAQFVVTPIELRGIFSALPHAHPQG